MKGHTKDIRGYSEPLVVNNFIPDPLLSPGGLPGKLTVRKAKDLVLFGFYVWGRTPHTCIPALRR